MRRVLVLGLLIVPIASLSCTQPPPPGPDGGSSAQQVAEPADPGPAAEQSTQPMTADTSTLDGLSRDSSLVFVGRLRTKVAEKDARGLLVTRNQFAIEQVIAGTFAEMTITLNVLGGTAGGETLSVSHMPEFMAERRYVVFTDPRRTVYNPITGNQRGVFLVVDDRVYTYDGRAVLGVENGAFRTGPAPPRDQVVPGTRERASSQTESPTTRGGIVSMERAPERIETPMSLGAFSRAVAAAARR